MKNYFVDAYVNLNAGVKGLFSNYFMAIAIVLLLCYWGKPNIKSVLRIVLHSICSIIVFELFSALFFAILFEYSYYYNILACLCTLVLYAVFFCKNSVPVRVMRSCTYFGLISIVAVMSIAMGTGIDVNVEFLQILLILFDFVLIFGGTALLRYLSVKDNMSVSNILIGVVIAVSIVCVTPVIGFFSFGITWNIVFVIGFFLLVLLLLLYYFISTSITRTYNNAYRQAHESMRTASDDLLRLNEKNLESLRNLRHEFKNQIFYMRSLLDDKKYDKLSQYFSEFTDFADVSRGVSDCGNHVIDVIVSAAYGKVQAAGGTLDSNIIVPPALSIIDCDLYSLIMNLINNAVEYIERSEGLTDKTVKLRINMINETLVISVDNCILPADEKRALSLKTSKSDKEIHGYGSGIVKMIAKKNNGAAAYGVENGRFTVCVTLTNGCGTSWETYEDL